MAKELKALADHFGKRTQDLRRAIRNLIAKDETVASEFIETTYIDKQGKPRPTYLLTQKGFVLLCMGFTGKDAFRWKNAYYDAFEAMRTKLLNI